MSRRRPGPAVVRRRRGERGAVTAELVMAIPLLLALVVGLCWLLSLGVGQVRLVDASREAARAVARGDDPGAAVSLARRIAPEGASIRVVNGGETVTVESTANVSGPGGLFRMLPAVTLRASAVGVMEGES